MTIPATEYLSCVDDSSDWGDARDGMTEGHAVRRNKRKERNTISNAFLGGYDSPIFYNSCDAV
jgi:hypothetical protein